MKYVQRNITKAQAEALVESQGKVFAKLTDNTLFCKKKTNKSVTIDPTFNTGEANYDTFEELFK